MRVVITGATGNVGTALVRLLDADSRVEEIVGLARRVPAGGPSKMRWVQADVTAADLAATFDGADAVVHLAWEIQPSHDLPRLWRTNVLGSRRVFEACAAAGVPALVHASSVGVYSAGPSDRAVSEEWPREGVPTCSYALHKAEAERALDRMEGPGAPRIVRMRPALIFSERAAASVGRLFLGPLVPRTLLSSSPVLPGVPGLRFQAVHSDDVAAAYGAALFSDVRGAVNVAAEPPIDMGDVASLVGARLVQVPRRVARGALDAAWRLRLQPTPAGWLDMGLGVPTMDVGRARRDLGWSPRRDALEALASVVEGLRRGTGGRTPALRTGRLRDSPDEQPRVEEER